VRLLPVISAIIECWAAVAFSATMRRYSAGVHVPFAIIVVRWKMVSSDAAVSRAIIMGNAKGELRRGFLINNKCGSPASRQGVRRSSSREMRRIASGIGNYMLSPFNPQSREQRSGEFLRRAVIGVHDYAVGEDVRADDGPLDRFIAWNQLDVRTV